MTADLLVQADRLLTGDVAARTHSVRAACWLARAALEEEVRRLLLAKRLEPGGGSMRSLLSCVESVYRDEDPGMVARLEYAWAGLSRAAHHHAFELSPSVVEARHLLSAVKALAVH